MHLGPYSALLLAVAVNGVLLATLLVARVGAHVGSRWLAALLVTLVLRIVPYILGFAGAYDTYQWLTFAPFDVTLAWGPLFWAYVVTLATGRSPARIARHFAPAAVQLAYQVACFTLPLERKWAWYTGPHLGVVEPLGALLVLLSLGPYAAAAWRAYEHWQQWLDANVSNREESRLGWLRLMVLALGGTAGIGAVMMLIHITAGPLDYVARLPVVGAIGALTYLLGLLAIRYGRGAIAIGAGTDATVEEMPMAGPVPTLLGTADASAGAPGRSYGGQARAWRDRIVAARWHHDPQLTLTTLAGALGTSPRTLSRVLNEGLGVSFNTFVNGLRVEDAIARLRQPGAPDVLRVAMDVGFASKASFNRAFRQHAGTTPSAIRAGDPTVQTTQSPPIARVASSESPA